MVIELKMNEKEQVSFHFQEGSYCGQSYRDYLAMEVITQQKVQGNDIEIVPTLEL